MNLDSPNLFHYATKELSQDAMICWLIKWASQGKGTGPEQEELRRCGRQFVSYLLNHKRDKKVPIVLEEVFKTEVRQQKRSIDVLARINSKYVLLIEDKTFTKDHDKQLQSYYDEAVKGRTDFDKVAKGDLFPVYLKTGNQSVADDLRIEAIENYKVFNRADFLNVLNDYRGRNSILLDFRQHLRELEEQTNSYTDWTRDAGRESWLAWQGFYRRLEHELDTSTGPGNGWGYVPIGDFLGFWWWPSSNNELYLQIEGGPEKKEARLCFKVDAGEDSELQEHLKWHWHERVLAAETRRVVRPRVMRIGSSMTVAWWKDEWMAFDKEDKLDISGTVENLKQAEAVLKSAIASSS